MLTVNQVFGLLKKDFLFEVRHLFQFGAILGFMLGIAYLFYFYSGEQTERAWSLSYWFSFLFICFFCGNKIFVNELGDSKLYTMQLIHPNIQFGSKCIFVITELALYSLVLWLAFWILLPMKVEFSFHWMILILLCVIAIGMILTFTSFISSNISGKQLLIAILSLPISFSIIGLGFSIGLQLMAPNPEFDFYSSLYPLIGINLFSAALLIFLVPLIWKS